MKSLILIAIFYVSKSTFEVESGLPCIPKDFGYGSIVCVCNATYCDTIEPLGEPFAKGSYYRVESSKRGKRFQVSQGNVSKLRQKSRSPTSTSIREHNFRKLKKAATDFWSVEITIDRTKRFQEIIGFGGAFTDATGINMKALSEELKNNVLSSYFSEVGLQYNLGRVPIASTDFSTHPYTYDDFENDASLNNFSLTKEDYEYKIPYLLEALKLNPKLKLFASPWTSPKWMKTNGDFKGRGSLKKEFYQLWADYFLCFLEEYSKQNLTFWAVTTQNEPIDGLIPGFPFNALGWTASEQRDWLKNNLGPTLQKSLSFRDVKIIILDDQRYLMPYWTKTVLRDNESAKYVSGIGLHWYGNKLAPVQLLDITHKRFPKLFILGTEACNGPYPEVIHVKLGDWERGENYASDIIQNFNHWMSGWVDWNLMLNLKGGPNWVQNYVDSPIIADSSKNMVYKQPMFYALGHFSKYIPQGSVRVHNKIGWAFHASDLQVLSCERHDATIIVVLLNKGNKEREIRIHDTISGHIMLKVDPKSINTIVYA